MTRPEAIAKAKKIKQLVLRGATEGERNAAQNRLVAFMKRHNLTEDDLSNRVNGNKLIDEAYSKLFDEAYKQLFTKEQFRTLAEVLYTVYRIRSRKR